MSTILDTARNIMAVIQPATGNRATGIATITASGADVNIPRNTFAMPVIDGRRRPDLVLKTDEGPGEKGLWTVTSSGDEITFISNIGGVRHNIPINTPISFDPPIAGLVSAVPTADAAFEDGTDADYFGGIRDMVIYENFDGPSFQDDLKRSGISKFPCVMVTWMNTEPADGTTISTTVRETRAGTRKILYKDTFVLTIVSSREDSDHARRHEGLDIADTISRLISDKQMVDKCAFSTPSGVQIRNIMRESGPENVYQKFYIYNILISTERTLQQLDSRTYSLWLKAIIDILKPQDPPLPNEGDFTLVDDMEVDMS